MMSDKYKYRVVIPGNHDTYQVDLQYDKIKSCLTGATHFPLHETVTIMGLSIYGVPWWPGHSWNYKLFKGWPNVKDPAGFGNIPDQIDVLLTHGPPNGGVRWSSSFPTSTMEESKGTTTRKRRQRKIKQCPSA
eukprot:jgi/Bigna1/89823/estExt_fgenesh1_pg.C_560059